MRKFLIAGLLAAVAVPVLAQPNPPVAPRAPIPPMAPMAMADKVMTRAEVDAKVRTHFARVDANRDGFITTDEMTAMRTAHQGQRSSMAGEHGRMGDHAMRDPKVAFDRIDTNRDGAISRDEFAKGREIRIEKRVVMSQGTPGQPGARMRMHGMGGGMMGGHLLKMADANKDGRVSLAEATAGARQHFDMMDANKDGRLTPEERRAGRGMMKQMRKAG